jgi:UDP-2,3-diacylglucosamine pyrophosphatase LpxH
LPGDVDNGKELTDMLKGFDVKAVLNGHYHRNTVLNFDGIPGIVNRTVMQKKDAPAAYTIYTVDDQIHVAEKRIGEPEEIWAELPLEK